MLVFYLLVVSCAAYDICNICDCDSDIGTIVCKHPVHVEELESRVLEPEVIVVEQCDAETKYHLERSFPDGLLLGCDGVTAVRQQTEPQRQPTTDEPVLSSAAASSTAVIRPTETSLHINDTLFNTYIQRNRVFLSDKFKNLNSNIDECVGELRGDFDKFVLSVEKSGAHVLDRLSAIQTSLGCSCETKQIVLDMVHPTEIASTGCLSEDIFERYEQKSRVYITEKINDFNMSTASRFEELRYGFENFSAAMENIKTNVLERLLVRESAVDSSCNGEMKQLLLDLTDVAGRLECLLCNVTWTETEQTEPALETLEHTSKDRGNWTTSFEWVSLLPELLNVALEVGFGCAVILTVVLRTRRVIKKLVKLVVVVNKLTSVDQRLQQVEGQLIVVTTQLDRVLLRLEEAEAGECRTPSVALGRMDEPPSVVRNLARVP